MNQIESIDIEVIGDGTCRIWCDTIEKQDVLYSLARDLLDVIEDEDAVFSVTPPSERKPGTPIEERPVKSFLTVRASYSEVSAALDAHVKMIRPYPKK
ncbi:MAG: hypothetical protein HY674_07570 [Chloroflexi bacterium]|nr:hypothetical protein [Chloroflexota bacterium]